MITVLIQNKTTSWHFNFRKVVGLVGKNAPVTSPEELELGKQLVADFMTNYREILPTVPPKVHFLEDHCVKQVPTSCINYPYSFSTTKVIRSVPRIHFPSCAKN